VLPRPIARRVHRAVNAALHAGWDRIRVAGAIAPGTAAAERFRSFGEGSIMGFPTAVLYGERHIRVGSGTTINTWVTLAAGYHPTQPGLPDTVISIGDRSLIGMRCGIVAHESVTIGDDVWFGQEVYVTDGNHGYTDPNTPPGNQLGAHQPVVIGDGCWLGHGTVVLAGAHLGRNVVVAAGSVVRGTFPDHAVIGGVPAKVIRRHEPGVGWVRPDGTGDVVPETPTIDTAQLAADLERLGELTDAELAAAMDEAPVSDGEPRAR
jgi:carbonic anhydrase/acetyltransferase-like protein (isoleucine patch superfamily)